MVAPLKRARDEFQAFYTDCNYITELMVSLLDCKDGMDTLEPCIGGGAFVDQMLKMGLKPNISGVEMNEDAYHRATEKYQAIDYISIENNDFIFSEGAAKKYDRIIANPPYGAYQSEEKRKYLKKKYPDIFTKETYGLFLYKAFSLLKDNGRLVFIIPDTFMHLHLHQGLRVFLIEDSVIESISLFPSKFFPNVNFGYAGLSVISIKKEKPTTDSEIKVYSGFAAPEELINVLDSKRSEKYHSNTITYLEVKNTPSFAMRLYKEDWIKHIFRNDYQTLDACFNVVTGFYSGNDAQYLRRHPTVSRGAKKYKEVQIDRINNENLSAKPPLDGIENNRSWVPIVKGGNSRFHKPSDWFMDWSPEAIHDYKVTNKKRARFQNSQYYFKDGIAVPMVASKLTAALIQGRLFDQSIVGIFPKTGFEKYLLYLLGLFNSDVGQKLVRTINASTNNSANYIKRVPLILPNELQLDECNSLMDKLIAKAESGQLQEGDLSPLNEFINSIYRFDYQLT